MVSASGGDGMTATRKRAARAATVQAEPPVVISAEPQAPTLWSELDRVYRCLARAAKQTDLQDISGAPAHFLLAGSSPEGWNPAAKLRDIFGLSEFELDILLLCAGAAVDRRFTTAIAVLQPHSPLPTFGLAASVLDAPHWSTISRMRPLRYWNLVELSPGPLLQAALTIDDRILQYLLGVPAADDRLDSIIHSLTPADAGIPEDLAELEAAAARGTLHWRRAGGSAILLTGKRASERLALFHTMCRDAGLHPWVLDAGDLPEAPADRERVARACTREAALWPSALFVRTERLENAPQLQAWLNRVNAPIAIDVEAGSAAERLSGLRLDAPSMSASGRKAHWQRKLGPMSAQLNGRLDAMVDAFALDAREIHETAEAIEEEISLRSAAGHETSLASTAWTLCRNASRRSLDELAARVENTASWSDLVLPEPQTAILRQIALHARHAARVNTGWGFGARYTRGLGLSALFAGPSGTGKTMAAGVLGRELDRDLYQIDLATVVSKYIGETEKHLRKIFDAAERSGAILLFDEADALFGKRTQVRDSHDRYANLEISYLLQRMETYRGIAILTTNMQNALDPAFQRRLRFVVQFPFPDAPSREQIWRKVFPASAPVAGLDHERLAQLNVTGGSIRNVALLSAFLAADADTPISMRHILEAARTEYSKLDKPLSAAETRGWE
ncbi:MAG TPA: ATP-binding protein [Terracidiphilus sp.]|nr:ATP-binding protein [Terracidiphilus sp.]